MPATIGCHCHYHCCLLQSRVHWILAGNCSATVLPTAGPLAALEELLFSRPDKMVEYNSATHHSKDDRTNHDPAMAPPLNKCDPSAMEFTFDASLGAA